MEDFFQVGIITATHGLRGEVKIYPTTDDVRRFKKLKKVILALSDEGGQRPEQMTVKASEEPSKGVKETDLVLEIERVAFFKQYAILKFKGLDRIEDVEKYRRYSLFVPRSNAVPLGKDEYFIADLLGLRVQDEDGTEIGILKDVMETGANDVYVITLKEGQELLLPAIKQCILAVDVEAGFIKVHILEGLL